MGPLGDILSILGAEGSRRGAQGDYFEAFGGHGWKCENDGFVFPKPSLSRSEGGPERACAALCAQFFSAYLSERLFSCFLQIWCGLGVHWRPFGMTFSVFFASCFGSQFLSDFGNNFGRGRRQGVSLLICLICNIWVNSCHALLPLRGAANLRASPPAAGPLSTGNCWQVDCWSGLFFLPKSVILETSRLLFLYLGHHFSDPGVKVDTKWTHWRPDVRFYRF